MLIGLSGKKQMGKDTVCKIIQYLTEYPNSLNKTDSGSNRSYNSFIIDMGTGYEPKWQKKMFAEKVKQIVCLLIGCTMEQLEDEKFKNKQLGEEWKIWRGIVSKDRKNPIYLWAASEQELLIQRQSLEEFDSIYTTILTPRLLLQLIGTECGRKLIHPNIWVNALMSDYKTITKTITEKASRDEKGYYVPADHPYNNLKEEIRIRCSDIEYKAEISPNWIITDVRFPNEVKAIEDRGGIVLRITNPRIESKDEHESETALDHVLWSFYRNIYNDGTIEDLVEKIKVILKHEKII